MPRLLPALAAILTTPVPHSDFADLGARAIHGPRLPADTAPGGHAPLKNLRAAITR